MENEQRIINCEKRIMVIEDEQKAIIRSVNCVQSIADSVNSTINLLNPSLLLEFKGKVVSTLEVFHNDMAKNEKDIEELSIKLDRKISNIYREDINPMKEQLTTIGTKVAIYALLGGFFASILFSVLLKNLMEKIIG